MTSSGHARLEDFGARGTVGPEERFKEYQEQCKGLSKRFQARFWLEVLTRDPEVAKLKGVERRRAFGRK